MYVVDERTARTYHVDSILNSESLHTSSVAQRYIQVVSFLLTRRWGLLRWAGGSRRALA